MLKNNTINIDIDSLYREAWETGVLYYKLQEHQKDLYWFFKNNKNIRCAAEVSRRFGKSYVSLLDDVEDAIRNPGWFIRIFCSTQSDGRDIVMPNMQTIIEDCPIDLQPVWKTQGSYYLFPNGSRIYIIGCDDIRDVNKQRGRKSNKNTVDECGTNDYLEYLYKSVILYQLMKTNGQVVTKFLGTPAVSPDHYFSIICDELILKKAYIKRTIDDDTSIDQNKKNIFIAESGGIDSTECRRELFCERVVDSKRAIVPEWSKYEKTNIVLSKQTEFYQFYHHYVSCDWGNIDKTAIIFGTYYFLEGKFQIEKTITISGEQVTTALIAEHIKNISKELWIKPVYRYIGDNTLQIVQDLNIVYGIPMISTTKTNLESMVNSMRLYISNILINPTEVEMIGNLTNGIWDKTRTAFERSKNYGHFDLIAALMYLIRNLDLTTNPIPDNYGLSIESHQYNNKKDENPFVAAVKR